MEADNGFDEYRTGRVTGMLMQRCVRVGTDASRWIDGGGCDSGQLGTYSERPFLETQYYAL